MGASDEFLSIHDERKLDIERYTYELISFSCSKHFRIFTTYFVHIKVLIILAGLGYSVLFSSHLFKVISDISLEVNKIVEQSSHSSVQLHLANANSCMPVLFKFIFLNKNAFQQDAYCKLFTVGVSPCSPHCFCTQEWVREYVRNCCAQCQT